MNIHFLSNADNFQYGQLLPYLKTQTLKCVGIDLKKDVFTQGQLYVAISRVRTRNGLKIYVDKAVVNSNSRKLRFTEIFD